MEDEDNPKKEIELVPVKIEPEAQPIVAPGYEAQRARTRQRRAQTNIQKNHSPDSILPEGTVRSRTQVNRYKGAGK